jgi:hypothetical protein
MYCFDFEVELERVNERFRVEKEDSLPMFSRNEDQDEDELSEIK